MRFAILVLLLTAAGGFHTAAASTFVYLRGEGADYVGDVAKPPRFFAASNAVITAGYDGESLQIQARTPGLDGEHWLIRLYARGAPLPPGTYEQSESDPVNLLEVDGGGRGCGVHSARAVVHEFEVAGDTLLAFSMDFEHRCGSTAPDGLYGSVRYQMGDVGCAGAIDGTTCDDGDACTAASQCTGGQCRAIATREACLPTAQCYGAGVCDPATAACSASLPVAAPCDDGNACTVLDSCAGGACRGIFRSCDDASPCTMDSCDSGSGCVHKPLADECWAVASRRVVRVRAAGRHLGRVVDCRAKCTSTETQLLLIDGDRYRLVSGPTACTNGTFDLTDEQGALVPRRSGRLQFESDNVAALAADLARCTGSELKTLRRGITMSGGTATLAGKEQLRRRTRRGLDARVTVTTEAHAAPFDPDNLPEPPAAPKRPLADCVLGVPVHCGIE